MATEDRYCHVSQFLDQNNVKENCSTRSWTGIAKRKMYSMQVISHVTILSQNNLSSYMFLSFHGD